MVQLINTQTNRLATYIKNLKESTIKKSDSGELNPKIDGLWNYTGPANVKNEDAVIATIQWLGESKFIEKLHYSLKSTNQQNNSAKQHHVILTFKLINAYAPHLILLRALFQFSSPSILSVSVDRHNQTFTIEVVSDKADVVTNYLKTIFNQLAKEIDFKIKLRQIIQWENHIRKEQKLIYRNVHRALS